MCLKAWQHYISLWLPIVANVKRQQALKGRGLTRKLIKVAMHLAVSLHLDQIDMELNQLNGDPKRKDLA